MRKIYYYGDGVDLQRFLIVALAPVVQHTCMDNTVHQMSCYPMDGVVCFVKMYPLESDLSGGCIIHTLNNWDQNICQQVTPTAWI